MKRDSLWVHPVYAEIHPSVIATPVALSSPNMLFVIFFQKKPKVNDACTQVHSIRFAAESMYLPSFGRAPLNIASNKLSYLTFAGSLLAVTLL